MDHEEADAFSRAPESDLVAFVKCCEVIRDSLGKMRIDSDLDLVGSVIVL